MKKNQFFYLLLIALTLISCFNSAGTWEDDNENWKRAFNYTPTDSIEVIHSWYWKSPHFTFEHEYFFELTYNETIKEQFLTGNDLFQLDSSDYSSIHHFNEKPNWFTPKEYHNYDVWSSYEYPNYFVFIDKTKRRIFLSDYSI